MAVVIIDPGHGGSDPGVVHGDTREKDAALSTAFTLQGLLIMDGHKAFLTRSNDTRPTFDERTKRRVADLYISVHYDCKGCRAPLYYASLSATSRARSEALGKGIAARIGREAKPSTASRFGRLYIDDVTYAPALLWEVDAIDRYRNTPAYRREKTETFVKALYATWKEVFRASFE